VLDRKPSIEGKDLAREAILGYIDVECRSVYQLDLTEIITILAKLGYVCETAIKELEGYTKRKGITKGSAWRNMIAKLFLIAQENKLPITISNQTDTLRQPSEFVRLVIEIHNQLPKVSWAPPWTRDALPKELSRIRARLRKSGILGH
jgi:hypothetical protein